jgi:hypothetical protein
MTMMVAMMVSILDISENRGGFGCCTITTSYLFSKETTKEERQKEGIDRCETDQANTFRPALQFELIPRKPQKSR